MSNEEDIPLGGGGRQGPPSIKLRNQGDYVDVAIVNEEKVPAYVYGTREVAKKPDGTSKTQDRLTVVVIGGTGVVTDGEADRQVVPGEVCTIYVEGQNRWDPDLDKTREVGAPKSYGGAKDDLGRQIVVGDRIRWVHSGELQGKGAQPRKLRLFQIRPANDEALKARCKQLHRELNDVPLGGGAVRQPEPELEPF